MKQGVVAIVLRDDRVLVIRRGSSVPFPGYWAPLSGKLEPGESFEVAVAREAEEEVGFVVEPIRQLWQSVSQDGAFRLHWWSAVIVGGALRPSEREVADLRWIEAAEHAALDPTFDPDREFFSDVLPSALAEGFERRPTRAVLFDFDFTLADSSAGVIECAGHALRRLGCGPAQPDQIRRTVGLSLEATFARLTGSADPTAAAEFRSAFVERADEVMAELTHPYPDTAPTVKRLRDQGLSLAIVSTKFRYRIRQILDRHGLGAEFAAIVGGEDVERSKPEPDALALACKQLGVARSDALYVGDHVVDAIAADAAGLACVVVLTGTCVRTDFDRRTPRAIIARLAELVVR